jgi:hypothetical protein
MSRPVGLGEALLHSAIWQGLWVWLVWAGGRDDAGLPLAIVVMVIAAAAWRSGTDWWRLLVLCAVGLACGLVVDGVLGGSRLVAYGHAAPGLLAPPWILALWVLFAAALALPLRRVLTRPFIAALAGLVGGPLAYLGGAALGATAFPSGERIGLAAVALGFGIATPVIVHYANRLLPPPTT